MRILHVTPYFNPAYVYGGPIVSIDHLCEELHNIRQEVLVLTTNANGANSLDIKTGVPNTSNKGSVIYFKRKWIKSAFLAPRLLQHIYQHAQSYDVVHIHTWWNLTSIPAVLICFLKNIKPILSPRGMLSPFSFGHRKSFFKTLFHRSIGRLLLAKTLLHATSMQEADECRRLLPNWQYFTAPNIIFFPDQCNHQERQTDGSIRLLFLSRIHEKKGLELLLESLATVTFSFELCITGKGEGSYITQLKALADHLDISQFITWHPWVNEIEKFALLSAVDVMVLPSQNENFANVVLESLSVGTPVLLTKQVGLSDYVESHNFGWVVEQEVSALSNALICAYSETEKRIHIRTTAPMQVRNDFAPQRVVLEYVNAYESLIHKRKPA